LNAIKECGGIAVVQDPADAEIADMPASALQHVDIDYCLTLGEIPELLERLTNTPIEPAQNTMAPPENLQIEARIPAMEFQDSSVTDKLGQRSTITCPECSGTLWEMNDERVLRYRCHTGHALTSETLAVDQRDAVEKALWIALKTLEESATLARRMASREGLNHNGFSRTLLEDRAKEAEIHASTLRELLMKI
jgi:two-component system, chemotaxis family, protein-glutamate methylesterase/glutaminase